MSSRIRLATLLAFFVTLGASIASAGLPEPVNNTLPPFVYVVGTVNQPVPGSDPFGATSIVLRDQAHNPIAGATVTVDFSRCCDIVLCASGAGHNCAARTVSGLTNGSGQFNFTVLGAARDPGTAFPPCQKEGCRDRGIVVLANAGTGWILIGNMTAIALDQNGGAGGSSGTTGSDVGALIQLYGSVGLGSPYRGRGDIDADGSISGADIAAMIGHLGRLSLIGGQGCTGALCTQPDCVPSFYGPGTCYP